MQDRDNIYQDNIIVSLVFTLSKVHCVKIFVSVTIYTLLLLQSKQMIKFTSVSP